MKRFIPRYIAVILLFSFLGCNETPKKKMNNSITTIRSKENIYTVSIDKDLAVFCTGTNAERDSKRIYYKELGKGDPILFYSVESSNKSVMPARLSGRWMVWLEYNPVEGRMGNWELCTKKISGRAYKQVIKSNYDNLMVEVPRFDISGNIVVFDYFVPSGSDSIDSPLFLSNIKENTLTEINAPKGYDLYNPSFNGVNSNEIVCCLISIDKAQKINSQIAIYQIDTHEWTMLSITNSGFQPCLYNKKLVFKESSTPYEYGTIKLFDLTTNQLQKLSTEPLGGETPQLNDNYVIWESPFFDQIPAYNLTTKKPVVIEKGNTGKPYLRGNSLIWVAEEKPNQPVIHTMELN